MEILGKFKVSLTPANSHDREWYVYDDLLTAIRAAKKIKKWEAISQCNLTTSDIRNMSEKDITIDVVMLTDMYGNDLEEPAIMFSRGIEI